MPRQSPILVAAAGTRTAAAQLGAAGIDRLVAYHSSVYRNRGLPSVAGLLPWGSANEQTLEMLPEVVAGAGSVPVIATVCANDGLTPASKMLDLVEAHGAVGVLNAPTVGLLTGPVRSALEQEGLGMRAEIRLLEDARDRGLEAWAYVFDAAWTSAAVGAGATGIIVHLGLTGHNAGAAAIPATETIRSCLAVSQDAPLLLHGGELSKPHDYTSLLADLTETERSRIAGFFGASAFERASSISSAVAGWRFVVSGHVPTTEHLEHA